MENITHHRYRSPVVTCSPGHGLGPTLGLAHTTAVSALHPWTWPMAMDGKQQAKSDRLVVQTPPLAPDGRHGTPGVERGTAVCWPGNVRHCFHPREGRGFSIEFSN